MYEGPAVAAALKGCGITDVVWIPDSELGRWDQALAADQDLRLIRVCREGEAFAVAAGLHLGGRRPIVILQCTGLYEAGDALRHVMYDLGLPLFVVVGVRSWKAYQRGNTPDSCPGFIEPYVRAWNLDFTWLNDAGTPDELAAAYKAAQTANRPGVALYPE